MTNVTIYSTSWCPYCDAAKRLLTARGVAYAEVDIETWDDPRGDLMRRTGGGTVPQIVVGATSIGGYDDLAALDRSGALEELLTPAA